MSDLEMAKELTEQLATLGNFFTEILGWFFPKLGEMWTGIPFVKEVVSVFIVGILVNRMVYYMNVFADFVRTGSIFSIPKKEAEPKEQGLLPLWVILADTLITIGVGKILDCVVGTDHMLMYAISIMGVFEFVRSVRQIFS